MAGAGTGQQAQVNTQPAQQPNVFGAAAQGMGQAGMTAGMETMYRPQTIASTDLTKYTNPYETQVVNQSLQDLERARQMQANQLGAQASQAGAFGGSRQAIMESELGRNYLDQAARTASGLRQAGFQNAQQLAGQDIGYGLQGSQNRQAAASTLGQLSNLGFGQGMALNEQSAQQGALTQGINQMLIDAARIAAHTHASTKTSKKTVGATSRDVIAITICCDGYACGFKLCKSLFILIHCGKSAICGKPTKHWTKGIAHNLQRLIVPRRLAVELIAQRISLYWVIQRLTKKIRAFAGNHGLTVEFAVLCRLLWITCRKLFHRLVKQTARRIPRNATSKLLWFWHPCTKLGVRINHSIRLLSVKCVLH